LVPSGNLVPASVRSLSGAIPGELPTAIGYCSFAEDSATIGSTVDGAGKGRIPLSNPVFQVRYPHGWIMVDAGMDEAAVRAQSKDRPFSAANYAQIQTALEGAGLIVVTHEHADHVQTLVASSIADRVAPHTLLTRESRRGSALISSRSIVIR
jgi:glyoxylase-like metal-dependent hydrolase (beta-lactamase superfamily II)